MADVGLGQLATVTGRARSRRLKDAVKDSHPYYYMAEKMGGIRRVDGGRSIVEEAKTAQNSTVSWVGETGAVSVADSKIADSAEFTWRYLLGSVSWSLAEKYQNSGGSDTKYIDIVSAKYEVLEDTQMNLFHEGLISNGTGYSGLQLQGLASAVSTTPTTGTHGGIDRSSSNALWFRNQKFDTSSDWSDGATDVGNIKRFLDKGIDATTKTGVKQVQCGFLGQTHWEYLNQAIQAMQVINDKTSEGSAGFEKLVYRGIPMFFGGGVNYSGYTTPTATRSYLLNVKPGGVNLVFHKNAEFDLLAPFESQDQAAVSRLMFTMVCMTIGGLAKLNWVGFD